MKSTFITLLAGAVLALAAANQRAPSDPQLYNDRAKVALEQMEHVNPAPSRVSSLTRTAT